MVDFETIAWGEEYRAVVSTTEAGRSMSLAKTIARTRDSDWVKLVIHNLPAFADGPWHWFSRGVVSMFVSKEPATRTLPPKARVKRNKKSWRVDLPVPIVTLEQPAAAQATSIQEAVRTASALAEWSRAEAVAAS